MQSTVLSTAFETKSNIVVSAPTSSGKTVIFEIAIARLLYTTQQQKALYLAPTKGLCSERTKDWAAKFQHLNAPVVELTGDSNALGLASAKDARIIISTPEKWDYITRRWSKNDHILRHIKLLLIDEVHFLRERNRGPCLEVLVSRMKDKVDDLRVIALSATVPNADDIAEWVGSNATDSDIDECGSPKTTADLFTFGETYRPCPLRKYVYGYANPEGDYWKLEGNLNSRIMQIIQEHANGRPVLIFAPMRKSASNAAEVLANEFDRLCEARNRPWDPPLPSMTANYDDPNLNELAPRGVAYHHAGLSPRDKRLVESAFLEGRCFVLVSTSSLAVGVNLPAYLVIIRGTKLYQGQWTEMDDLDILQMMGRAGRPQFDREGVCVIMTENNRKDYYVAMARGETPIESTLHLSLIEHVNAEIGQRESCSQDFVENWLRGTFLFVRMKKNLRHYQIEGAGGMNDPEHGVQNLSRHLFKSLREHELLLDATQDGRSEIACSHYGDLLASYFISFKTFLRLLRVKRGASTSDILQVLCLAEEFCEIRIRHGEKGVWNKIRTLSQIRFPPKKVTNATDKLSILIQAVLAGVNVLDIFKEEGEVFKAGFQSEARLVFRQAPRILKCLVDIAVHREDGKTAKDASELVRSTSGQAWDSSPATLRQLDNIGEKYMQLLSEAGIKSIGDVADSDPLRMEHLLNRRSSNFGFKLVQQARSFPDLDLMISEVKHKRFDDCVESRIELAIDLKNSNKEVINVWTAEKQPRYIICLTTSSEGELFDYRRMSRQTFQNCLQAPQI
ncbi:P-loop containing nucleoside triphosphate hydrolase protein [Acaromyces ingoldii]|uniref:P-loop containing nucleoside triphosphate hydrolase protein n=1 Tax=Acaromyces ingoldii TaxID=215250 RepID=A0A316YIA4_9BASI|nr:P-loop containing nucleoside triphosphate hydrolase protein [Acaromyces ingoldii]PWN88358.1 P-loop containing nucleoside triphosphate hydrolase protein [Acaromyces ingoldii]